MSDERPLGDPPPEEVGADTAKFQAFVREGEQLERQETSGSNSFRLITLAAGLLVLAGVVFLLLR